MSSPLNGGPAFKLCSEAILQKVRWQAHVAELGVPLYARLVAEGHSNTARAFEQLREDWALVQWGGIHLARIALDEDVHRAIMLRHGPLLPWPS